MQKNTLWVGWLCVLLAATLAACRAGFPTDKFVRSENGVSSHLIFMNGGRWEGYQDGNLTTFGNYRIQGQQLLIDSDFLCEETGMPAQASYQWSFDDDVLTLQPVGPDGCAERVELFSQGPFTRSQ